MGDGINDAYAMKNSDVGISVDSAVDIAKESADIILLEKSLMVLEKGVVEGRKTFGNIMKYIKMTVSSNFGNMLSVLIASAFLPFLPMQPIQLLLLNLIYDISCISIPWDNIDKEYIIKPRKWSAQSILKFMLRIGPISSIFDILTYAFLFFVICPLTFGALSTLSTHAAPNITTWMQLFNAGWFIESLWTQTFIIHLLRTAKTPFTQSRASIPVVIMTSLAVIVGTIIPYTSFGANLGMQPLPAIFFAFLIIVVAAYFLLNTFAKKLYVKQYGEFL
jgi:Mg2+-importing ATPase